MAARRQPGQVRDAILDCLRGGTEATVAEIRRAVIQRIGEDVAASSVRSYLNINTPTVFTRTGRGRYRLGAK